MNHITCPPRVGNVGTPFGGVSFRHPHTMRDERIIAFTIFMKKDKIYSELMMSSFISYSGQFAEFVVVFHRDIYSFCIIRSSPILFRYCMKPQITFIPGFYHSVLILKNIYPTRVSVHIILGAHVKDAVRMFGHDKKLTN